MSKKRQRKEEDKLLMGLNTTTADPKKNMKTSMADASLDAERLLVAVREEQSRLKALRDSMLGKNS